MLEMLDPSMVIVRNSTLFIDPVSIRKYSDIWIFASEY
jgi:hypothetical protein